MRLRVARAAARIAAVAVALTATAAAAPRAIDANAAALAQALAGHRVILLGEVHDNAAQHALRVAALRLLVEHGARPAVAFEQFDLERQVDIDRARKERPRDADYLIEQAKGAPEWPWRDYRPFVALALEYDLPIVAANLSRGDAMRVAREGFGAAFDGATVDALRLDALPPALVDVQTAAIAAGHCNALPPQAIAPQVRAQVARDVAMARAIAPHAARGIVLLAGNGHVRRDVGVPVWLRGAAAADAFSVGLLESDAETPPAAFDAYVVTAPAARAEDPCAAFERSKAAGRPRS